MDGTPFGLGVITLDLILVGPCDGLVSRPYSVEPRDDLCMGLT